MEAPLVSIILAAYNAEELIRESIGSVLAQDYPHWELLVVNDGSTDGTGAAARGFCDSRIRCFDIPHAGVSAARNRGLSEMRGAYFCFLDADDLLTPTSLSARLRLFRNDPQTGIVDGTVIVTRKDTSEVLRTYHPRVTGRIVRSLALLTGEAFCMPSAMFRREAHLHYAFDTAMTHAEDLWFLVNVHASSQLLFARTDHPIVYYRRLEGSAMSNLDGLGAGYLQFYGHVKRNRLVGRADRLRLKYRVARIMFLSFVSARRPGAAFRFLLSGIIC